MKWFRKNSIEKNLKLKEELLRVISLPIKKECVELIDYQENYTLMSELGEFLKELTTKLPNVYDISSIKRITTDIVVLNSIYQSNLADINLLITEEEKIANEIIQYSEAVKEMQEKFKLSIDWGGKKPHMISLGKQLTKKRENCLKAEQVLKKKLEPLNQSWIELFTQFQEQYVTISAEIDKYIR